jgi:hypothetical protein
MFCRSLIGTGGADSLAKIFTSGSISGLVADNGGSPVKSASGKSPQQSHSPYALYGLASSGGGNSSQQSASSGSTSTEAIGSSRSSYSTSSPNDGADL